MHNVRKPIKSKYLDTACQQVILKITKRRFTCHKFKKTFTETIDLSSKDGSISNKLKIQIRKDLLDYNLSLRKIAERRRVSDYIVSPATATIPHYIKNLPRVFHLMNLKQMQKKENMHLY